MIKSIEIENGMVVRGAGGGAEECWRVTVYGYRGFQDEKSSGDCLYAHVNVINTSELYI